MAIPEQIRKQTEAVQELYKQLNTDDNTGAGATPPADGTVTLTAVAWDSIQKIIVRQVEGLPDGMFE